jgi:hypothetical protein
LKLSCSGEPKPRWVRTRISDGRARRPRSAASAAIDRLQVVAVVDADRLPAVRPKRLARSSENVMSVPAESVTELLS